MIVPRQRKLAADLERHLAGEPIRLRPALYGDILRRRIAAYDDDLRDWRHQGMVSDEEHDRIEVVHRRILADEDHWIVDARHVTRAQVGLYAAVWAVVVACGLLVVQTWEDVGDPWRWVMPMAMVFVLGIQGIVAYRRENLLPAGAFLGGAVLAAVPAMIGVFARHGILASRPDGIEQILTEPFGNLQFLVAVASAALLSLLAWRLSRLTAFAWTTTFLAAATYFAWLTTRDLLGKQPEDQALRLFSLTLFVLPGLVMERMRFIRWASPCFVIALVGFVGCLDVMALRGTGLEMLGVEKQERYEQVERETSEGAADGQEPERVRTRLSGFRFDESRLENWSLAVAGLILLVVCVATLSTSSLDLRRGSRILELAVPFHLLGGFLRSALDHDRDDDRIWGRLALPRRGRAAPRRRHRVFTTPTSSRRPGRHGHRRVALAETGSRFAWPLRPDRSRGPG